MVDRRTRRCQPLWRTFMLASPQPLAMAAPSGEKATVLIDPPVGSSKQRTTLRLAMSNTCV